MFNHIDGVLAKGSDVWFGFPAFIGYIQLQFYGVR